ncbi:hypothetical protein ACLOJK_032772 [Asimina triloba]
MGGVRTNVHVVRNSRAHGMNGPRINTATAAEILRGREGLGKGGEEGEDQEKETRRNALSVRNRPPYVSSCHHIGSTRAVGDPLRETRPHPSPTSLRWLRGVYGPPALSLTDGISSHTRSYWEATAAAGPNLNPVGYDTRVRCESHPSKHSQEASWPAVLRVGPPYVRGFPVMRLHVLNPNLKMRSDSEGESTRVNKVRELLKGI